MQMTFRVFALLVSIVGIATALSRWGRRWLARDFANHRLFLGIWIAGNLVLMLSVIGYLMAPKNSELWAGFAVITAIWLFIFSMITVFFQRRPQRQECPKRFLAIGAHPDDVELACGATIAKLVDSGHEVRIMVMSRGENGGNAPRRMREAERGAAYLGAQSHSMQDFCDTRLAESSNEMVAAIEREIALFNPDVVLTHSATDIHQDHEAVHRAVMRAGRKLPSILCFESPSVSQDFSPKFFVDVEKYTDVKVEAIKLHSDQRTKPYMTRTRTQAMANFRGSQVKQKSAEGFEVMRLVSKTVGDF